jgi:hypothetical protein
VYAWLTGAIIVASLLVGAWCFVAAARDAFLDRPHLIGLAVVAGLVLVQTVVAVVRLAGGEKPEEFVTFLGYLATAVLTVPAGVSVAFMEKTRYGSIIAGASAVIVAVLALRLWQLWTPLQ